MPALLRDHVGQDGGNAVQHALEVHIDHAVPILDLKTFETGVRHEPGVVDDHVDAAVRLHRAVHQTLDLIALGHIGLNDSAGAERKRLGDCLKPVEAPRSQHEFGAVLEQDAARPLRPIRCWRR